MSTYNYNLHKERLSFIPTANLRLFIMLLPAIKSIILQPVISKKIHRAFDTKKFHWHVDTNSKRISGYREQ